MRTLVPAPSPTSPPEPLSAAPPGPRGDWLFRAVIEALVRGGYEPVERRSTSATSCVLLAARASAAGAPARHLQVTHLPARHRLLLELVPRGVSCGGSTGRRIYWYYQAQQPADRARIAASLAASIASA